MWWFTREKTSIGSHAAPEFHKPMKMAKELGPDTALLQCAPLTGQSKLQLGRHWQTLCLVWR
jgi:hypothetical protein